MTMTSADQEAASTETSLQENLRAMGVFGVAAILLRWLPVIIPLSALSLYTALNATSEIQPEYTADAAVLLVGPNEVYITDTETDEITVEEVNPLSALGGSLSTVAGVTALAMQDGAVYDQIEAEGLSPDFEVSVRSRSPVILVTAIAEDPDVAAATADRIVGLIADDLDRRQDELDAPETDRFVSQRIGGSTVGPPDYGGRNRVRLAIAVVGLGSAIAIAFVLEALYQLYRRRRRGAASGTEELSTVYVDRPLAELEAGVSDRTNDEQATSLIRPVPQLPPSPRDEDPSSSGDDDPDLDDDDQDEQDDEDADAAERTRLLTELVSSLETDDADEDDEILEDESDVDDFDPMRGFQVVDRVESDDEMVDDDMASRTREISPDEVGRYSSSVAVNGDD